MSVWILLGFFILFGVSKSSDATSNTSLYAEEYLPTMEESYKLLKRIIKEGFIKFEKEGTVDPLLQYVTKRLVPPGKLMSKRPAHTFRILDRCPKCPVVPQRRLEHFGISAGSLLSVLKSVGVCGGCAILADTIIHGGFTQDVLIKLFTSLCHLGDFETKPVCTGLIAHNADILFYIKTHKNLIAEEVCSICLQDFRCFRNLRPQWSISVPSGNSPQRIADDRLPSINKIRILQLTDIHIDPMYRPGANAHCAEVVCCQRDRGNATIPEHRAGKWGDYRNCDMPFYSLVNTLNHIVSKQLHPEVSYVYFTGDVIGHRIWSTSTKRNTNLFKRIYNLFYNKFGTIPVYPILGNHEPHPLNAFPPHIVTDEKLSTQWLFDKAVEEWSRWLPKETHETIRHGGFYTVLVKPGFRIIALNSNVCFIYNWWLLYDSEDPYDQLQWLTVVLVQAEAKNESVHILSHVPPGDNTCLQAWSRQFRKIVERFSNTITGQFNGHTHFVEWRVFYNSSNSSQAINVAYNGGSFTTFNNLNPNYRFYDIDSETYEVLDYQDWTYKVDKANKYPKKSPNWYKLTSFKDDYQLKSLKPRDIGELVSKMEKNSTLVTEYYRFKNREAKPAMDEGCSKQCLKENWCSIVYTEVGFTNYARCKPFI